MAKRLKGLYNKAWKLMSEWVRRSENGVCFICGDKRHWKLQQAGHWNHRCLDFNPYNIHCSCVRCNKWLHGNLGLYSQKLIEKYGVDILQELTTEGNKIHKYTTDELEWIIRDLEEKIKKLDNN